MFLFKNWYLNLPFFGWNIRNGAARATTPWSQDPIVSLSVPSASKPIATGSGAMRFFLVETNEVLVQDTQNNKPKLDLY